MRLISKILAASAAALVTLVAAVPATADPGVTPKATDIVSVGEATFQLLDNRFSTDFNATAPASKYYSWDATGSNPITPKVGSIAITRPNGAGAGISALNSYTHTTVDMARSGRGPKTGGDPSTNWFIAFAKDAVGWSAFTGGNAPSTLSVVDLKAIYGCTVTRWNQITDIPGYTGGATTIKAYLPPTTSTTRVLFLSALGITTPGACVQATLPEENEGTNAVFTANRDVVFPYSIGHFVGQKYKGRSSGSDAPGVLDSLRSIKFSSTSTIAQVNTSAQTINSPFSTSLLGRNLYHVVRIGDWNDFTLGPRLKVLLDTNGWICMHGSSDIIGYGFIPFCGGITHT